MVEIFPIYPAVTCPNWSRQVIDGIEHLAKARGILCDGPTGSREVLRKAAREFWSAYFYVQTWPHPLWIRADGLVEKILRHGVIEQAVVAMSDASVLEISQELLSLCEDAERHMLC